MSTTLASPKRLAIAAVPVVGIVLTPLFPFISTPTFWLGLPAAVVWMSAMVILAVVALQIVERSYLREGGADLDRLEQERDAARRATQDAAEGEGH
ncbi:hypothetical protein [Pseudarthrobacter sp. NPDC057230]|uniref:hypothetical protein n=1 Tax=Pseudarthrobacter sp. NPDC057230 TaxID=3346057 RepID=UPI00362524A6